MSDAMKGTLKHLLSRRDMLTAGVVFGATAGNVRFAEAKKSDAITPPVYGGSNAPKRFSVWGSYTCPYTATLLPVLIKIVDDYPQKVSLEWHNFPTHQPDPALHVAGLAFKGKKFWSFTLSMLKTNLDAGGSLAVFTPEKLNELARAQGESEKLLKAAYDDPAKWKSVKDDFLAGQLLGVSRTPGLFYSGYFLTPGGLPYDMKAFDASLRNMVVAG